MSALPTSDAVRKVVVFGKINEAGLERLRAAGGFAVVERPDHPPDRIELAADADAIVVRMTRIDAELVAAAPRLSLVARHGVGYDTVDVDALTARGIPLALVGDCNSGAVAEHTLTLMLALVKRIPAYDRAVREGDFAIRDSFSAGELFGRTVLLIGFGRIGRKVARLCQGFDMRICVADPLVAPAEVAAQGYDHVADFRVALGEADFVTVHAPRSPDAVPLIGRAELGRMRPGAFLVNVARGGMVDETALVEALDSGRLAGAGLDVFETEPPAADHPIARRRDVVLTPHSAAFTAECSRRMALACAENVIAYFRGRLDAALVVNRAVLDTATP